MQTVLMACAGVLLLGMIAQWLAWRFRLPSILLLLGFGFVAGRFLNPDDLVGQEVLFPVISLAVAAILLEGGLSLSLREIVATRWVVTRLCTLGAAIAWILTALGAFWIVGLDLRLAALLGAILVVTGPTVIGPLLRQIRPIRSVGAIAKWESIVVDPIGASLAVLVFQAVSATAPDHALLAVSLALGKTLVLGVAGGYGTARLLEWLFHRHLIPDFLHSPTLLAVALMAFAASNHLQSESGLLTVTVLGITLANQTRFSLEHILEFKENLRVLLLSSLFIVLAARVDPAAIRSLAGPGIAFLVALILVVRPLSVWLSTIGGGLPWKHRLYLGFLAPRGIVAAAVSTVFAIEIQEELRHGHLPGALGEQAAALVPLTFLVIVGTVLFYGLLAAPLARRLGLATASPQGVLVAGAAPWMVAAAKSLKETGKEVLLVDTNADHVSQARMAGLPARRADVLSRYVTEELELFGIGKFLGVTPNFEINTLACREFIRQFGRENVFQLQVRESPSQRSDLSHQLVGRPLFGRGVTHDTLDEWLLAGAKVKTTKLTEKFGPAEFAEQYGEHALPLFAISAVGKLTVATSDGLKPANGTTVISLVHPAALAKPSVPTG